jgi:general secretion pathway protein C
MPNASRPLDRRVMLPWTGRGFSWRHAARGLEWLVLAVIILQGARLIWVVLTPVGPVGTLRPQLSVLARSSAGDPFFRANGTGPDQVTALPLKLFGIRVDEAAGGGSAIIATPDGVQSSYGVGETILAGTRLTLVARDHVVLETGGKRETLFLDQSVAALGVGQASQNPLIFAPRVDAGRITGLLVNAAGADSALARTGLQSGDVVTAINGQPVTSADEGAHALSVARTGTPVSVTVDRNGKSQSLTVKAAP